jgi:hypothetical protein
MILTQERLRDRLDYDPATGIFTWKKGSRIGWEAGSLNLDGARQIQVDNRVYMASHLAFLWMEGYLPKEVDHRDRQRDNNRWGNLREATRSQNCVNRHGRRIRHHDLPRGVYRVGGAIIAKIVVNKERVYLGSFQTIEEAKQAYDAAASNHHGEFLPNA